jgi:hypothetical protein
LLLGGLVAVPGGECAPDASSGFDASGVVGTYGPGSVQPGVGSGADAALPAAALVLRYVAATLSCDWQSW